MPNNAIAKRARKASARRANQGQVKFLDFIADLNSGELFHKGKKVPVQEKPFQVLALLLSGAGDVIPRKEICVTVWPESHGEAEASLNTAMRKLRAALGDSPRNSRVIQTVGKQGYRMMAAPELPGRQAAGKPIRIAVTPFENPGGSEHDYFAEWLTEQMIVQLADPQADVRIIAPVQARRRGRAGSEERETTGESQADYVLGGKIARVGGSMRVTAKFVRVADQSCVWSETYSRQVLDVFRAQDEITLQIACSILRVMPKRPDTPEEQSTSPEAYGKTLKGRHFAEKWNDPAFDRSIAFFEQAIAADPDFARAHAALARTHAGMLQFGVREPSFNQQRVRTEAAKALELCPDLPDAVVALGCAKLFYDADWAGAEKSFRHALQVSPGSAYAHECYTRLLLATGRPQEAIAAARCARKLNSLSPYSNVIVGVACVFGRRFEEAIDPCLQCIEMEPGFAVARAVLGRAYEGLGRFDEAIETFREAVRCAPHSAVVLANLAGGLGFAGQEEESRELLFKIHAMRQAAYVPGYWIAACHAGLGEHEAAIEWLRTAVRERCGWRVFSAVEPRFDPLRDDPEFQEILKEIGIPEF